MPQLEVSLSVDGEADPVTYRVDELGRRRQVANVVAREEAWLHETE